MILFLLLLGMTIPASAQMTDLMGNLAIDGMLTAQSMKGYNTANLQLKKNNLSQELQIKSIEFQTLVISGNKNVSRETFSIAGYSSSVQMENVGDFSITVNGIEKSLCLGIDGRFAGAKKIKINQNNKCADKNIIKFYY